MKFIFDQFKPYMFSFWSEVRVWQKETCQYRPSVLLLGLISEIKSSYLTWQNSPKLWKHVGVFLFFFFSFLRVFLLFFETPIQESTLVTYRLRQRKSLDNIFNFSFSFSESSLISQRQFSTEYSFRDLIVLQFTLGSSLLSDNASINYKDGRTANGKVFQRKYDNLKGKFALDFISYLVFLDLVSWVRGSSGNVNLAVSLSAVWMRLP